jgi:metal-responsive CopG/Arc/MetJ family transcriptional regulator
MRMNLSHLRGEQMSSQHAGRCKVTVSLPCALLEYADREAGRASKSRSEVISQALMLAQKLTRDEQAARGYAHYARESEEFAAAAQDNVPDWWEAEDWGA